MSSRDHHESTSRPTGARERLEIAVYSGRLEITERPGDSEAEQLVMTLRELGVETELVFKSPCG